MKKVFGLLAAVAVLNTVSSFACEQDEVTRNETTQEVVVQETQTAEAAE